MATNCQLQSSADGNEIVYGKQIAHGNQAAQCNQNRLRQSKCSSGRQLLIAVKLLIAIKTAD